ncbi:MAG: EAL domain-containing protein [Leptolyngbya sp. SIO1D8]|nr:EAL domain-containing protein [Leptolyngbya sp. SIO1D8]
MQKRLLDWGNGDVGHDQLAISMLKLLIVEDVQADVELIALSLDTANLHFHYEVADTLEQCRALLVGQTFNAVLADYRLPTLRAPQVFQLVSELRPNIPFILVTGNLREEAAVECIEAGMTDYVLKDRLYRLPTVLRRALDEAELKNQRQVAISQLEQQAWRESILNHIVQTIRETPLLDEIMQTTAHQLKLALRVDQCLFVQPGSDQQISVQCRNDVLLDASSAINQLCGRCSYSDLCAQFEGYLRRGQQIILHESDTTLSEATLGFLKRHQLGSVLIMPLNYQHRYLGSLLLSHLHEEHSWVKVEVSLVQAVAEQCAIAIYQSNLYEQAQHELEQRQRVEDQLRYDALHDGLTGLPNRTLFLDRLNHALQIAYRRHGGEVTPPHSKFAVLFLDLDDFRIVNDSLGHDAGDFLLRVVANRLSRCLRAGDTLARTSGDEFAILLEDINDIDDMIDVVERLQDVLKRPILLESQEIFVSACIGIVINAPNYNDAAQFLRDADTAMYQAKEQGRGQYQVFDGSMHTQVRHRLQVENDLRRALDRHELSLVYQPIIHLPTQKIHGFEALIRWQEPIRGMLSPNHFIPVAEQTGLIVPIGQWVLHQACQQWKKWLLRWPDKMQECSISVNLSAKQFAQPFLIDQIDDILQEAGVDSRYLRLEITESALIDNEITALETLKQLKARKIQVVLDDFGTGYSSLSYLLRFPKDVLKIDKSFVSNLENSPDNQEIVKTILALGNNLGLDIVGEGIETEYQAKFLVEQGCLLGQGYWFSAPLVSAVAEEKLAAQFDEYV